MKIAVRYYSKSGNTKKLACAIADAVGTTAKTTDEPIAEQVDVLFLGGALYAGSIDAHLRDYIRKLTPEKVKSSAVFSTSASGKSIQPQVEGLLNGTGITISGDGFSCKGKFLFINIGRPSDKDCSDAVAYAKAIMEKLHLPE
jgi:flavodoxin